MHRPAPLVTVVAGLLAVAFITSASSGHTFMVKPFKSRYELRSLTCYACHVKGEEKDVVGPFGEQLKKLLDGKDISARAESLKDAGKEERDAMTEELTNDLVEALHKLDKLEAPSGKSYGDAIREGEIEGAKPRKPKS